MRVFAFVTFASTIILLCAVGIRLLAAARRTGGAPELTMGVAFLCGGLGFGVRMLAVRGLDDSDHAFAAYLLGAALAALAPTAISIGVWRIFRPQERWAAGIVLGLVVLFGWYLVALVSGAAIPDRTTLGLQRLLDTTLAIAGYGWCSAEALHYHGLTRRQVRLGLVEPLVVEQFRLWGLGMASLTAVPLASLLAVGLFHRTPSDFPLLFLGLQAITVAAAVGIYLGFFPTAGTARRVEARGAASPPA